MWKAIQNYIKTENKAMSGKSDKSLHKNMPLEQ